MRIGPSLIVCRGGQRYYVCESGTSIAIKRTQIKRRAAGKGEPCRFPLELWPSDTVETVVKQTSHDSRADHVNDWKRFPFPSYFNIVSALSGFIGVKISSARSRIKFQRFNLCINVRREKHDSNACCSSLYRFIRLLSYSLCTSSM